MEDSGIFHIFRRKKIQGRLTAALFTLLTFNTTD